MSVHQDIRDVIRAELRRHAASRGLRVRLSLILGAAILAGWVVLAFVSAFDPEGAAGAGGTLPTALEVSGGVAALLLGLNAMSAATAETTNGTVLSSLLLVPSAHAC